MSVIVKSTTTQKKNTPALKQKRGLFGTIMHKIDSALSAGAQLGPVGPRGTTSPKSVMTIKKKSKPK